MTKVTCWKRSCALFTLCAAMGTASPAQTFTTLVNFDGTNGAAPFLMALVQGTDGDLYGSTYSGGTNNSGTIFKITPEGKLTTLYSFCALAYCADGVEPVGLTLATDGSFYGTTNGGGAGLEGTVFRITSGGTLTTLNSFCRQPGCPDGAFPFSGVVQGTDGNFYGTTLTGGYNGRGTVFKITPSGTLTTLHNFCADVYCTDGADSYAGLVLATDGNFYGTTSGGGSDYSGCNGFGCGTVFKMSPRGTLTTLHSFNSTDGWGPSTALVQGTDGNFYGTTQFGAEHLTCLSGCGTAFKITPEGTLTTLYIFCTQTNCTDGANPRATLVEASDGNFYGTTLYGGHPTCDPPSGCGTVFKITPEGTLTTVHNFDGTQGQKPSGGLVQASTGNFYGTTYYGGTYGDGTIFSLNMGFSPFVVFVRNPAKTGQTFGVLGQGFIGTTGVTLNGTPVNFTVKSDTLLTATVPAGGTTGPVTVTTPTDTLTSNVPFRVLPQLLSFTPMSGPVGTQVTLTGVSFTQTTGVGFGDYTPAQFTVNSDKQVTATVPTGAQTGPVGVQTQGGIAISTQTFTVTQ